MILADFLLIFDSYFFLNVATVATEIKGFGYSWYHEQIFRSLMRYWSRFNIPQNRHIQCIIELTLKAM